jgi:Carboxypeptidase regulatory-like domain
MNSRLSGILAAAALLGACHGPEAPVAPVVPATPSQPAVVAVFGHVVDLKTSAGVANAAIKFYIPPFDATAGEVATDETGYYQLLLPPGTYNPRINGPGPDSNRGTIRPVGASYLADYFVNGNNCVMFYGTIRSAATGALIAGATIAFVGRTQISGGDGSYQIDLGCPTGSAPFGTGTTFMVVSNPGYVTQQPWGNRREFLPADGLQRIDVNLQPAASVAP